MYSPQKQHHRSIDFGDDLDNNQMMIIEVVDSAEDHEHEIRAPKKRAETWAQDEIRALINLRREIDFLFNATKSNRHLWDQISAKMREKGFDRSPTMCTDKWRNLLKEFKRAKHQLRGNGGGGAAAKMSYHKEIAEILRDRSKGTFSSKVDSYIQSSVKDGDINSGSCLTRDSFYLGLDDPSISFGHMEANGRSTLNLERRLDHEGQPLSITEADTVGTNGVNPWNWRETSGNGGDGSSYEGRIITVKWGDFTRKVGVDGAADAIKEAIKSAFGLRTRRGFWLEDEYQVIRSLDRGMPLGTYTLHLDEGITIKLCSYDESNRLPVRTEEKTFYSEDEFHEFLNRQGWSCLRELTGFRSVDTIDELRPAEMYQGVMRLLTA
ncbi:hypothetical protein Sjap_016405 [Stephania japonica]|uniref:Myb-like domain-containing protein n=1 Tax=Stephania japonica TaxID=461633 RepID=A0AAP0NSC6_9MAGN